MKFRDTVLTGYVNKTLAFSESDKADETITLKFYNFLSSTMLNGKQKTELVPVFQIKARVK